LTFDKGDSRGGVVGAAAVARRDGEPLNLRVQDLEPGQLLDGGVPAWMLVDADVHHRSVELLHLQRNDLLKELALIHGCDRALVRPRRPRVHLLRLTGNMQ